MAIASNLDIQRLEHLYKSGFRDTFLDNALRKVIERQIARDWRGLMRLSLGSNNSTTCHPKNSGEVFRPDKCLTAPTSWNGTSFARCGNALSPVCKSYGAAMGQHY